jgi:hypothetical protein
MDLSILKKKISSYRTEKGSLTRVPDELAMEILFFWEQWTGPAASFYQAISMNPKKMASVLGHAKKLKRDGFGVSEFKELQIASGEGPNVLPLTPCNGAEVIWNDGKIIRFSQVDLLLEFLKKAA